MNEKQLQAWITPQLYSLDVNQTLGGGQPNVFESIPVPTIHGGTDYGTYPTPSGST